MSSDSMDYLPAEIKFVVDVVLFVISWGEQNTAVTTYFGEIVFFTKMETIFNNTDCDKLP